MNHLTRHFLTAVSVLLVSMLVLGALPSCGADSEITGTLEFKDGRYTIQFSDGQQYQLPVPATVTVEVQTK